MKTYTPDELRDILGKHHKWLCGENEGARADLSCADLSSADISSADLRCANLSSADLRSADLSYANLSFADLSYANLRCADPRCANLSYANLSFADLSYTNLRCADLSSADLSSADLRCANLSSANLSSANLRSANLSSADLRSANLSSADLSSADYLDKAKNLIFPIACPEKGAFTAFKACRAGLIVELLIPADAKRSSATGRKCRCDKAVVIDITNQQGTPADTDAVSRYNSDFIYRKGDTISVENFDDNRWNECAPGIHFFITRQEAVDYGK